MVYVVEETDATLAAHPVSNVVDAFESLDGAKRCAEKMTSSTISWRDTKYGSFSQLLPDDRRFYIWPFELKP